MIWFLRATSQEIRNSSLTRVCPLVLICCLANSRANFLHLDAQISRYFILAGAVDTASVSVGVSGKVVSIMVGIIPYRRDLSTPHCVFFRSILRIDVMQKFEKDQVELLKALREIVTENLNYADVRAMIDSDVAEFIMELQDRRRLRKLKKVLRSLDEMIKETISERRLREQERLFNEAKLKQTNEAYAAHCNADQ